MSPSEFWNCRVRDLIDLLVGTIWQKQDESEQLTTLAWKIANLNRKQKLPRLKKLLKKSKPKVVKGEKKKKLQQQHQERLERMGVEQVSDVD